MASRIELISLVHVLGKQGVIYIGVVCGGSGMDLVAQLPSARR
jgi:hypothetical protein